MKVKSETLILNPFVGRDYKNCDGGDVVILRTISTYRLKEIESIQNNLISIGYKPASRLTRKLFRWTMKYLRSIPHHQILYSSGKIIKILYDDKDLEMIRDWNKVDFSKAAKLNHKRIDGKMVYTMTTPDGTVYEAYKHKPNEK